MNMFVDLKPIKEVPFPPPKNPSFTFIDLFAGIGGFRLALQQLNGKCVFSSEIDKFACETYKANFGESPYGDITLEEVKKNIPNNFDLLCAGFPCQPFSYAGRNEGFKDKARGTLFFDVLDIIENKKPKAFILENVKGLKSHEGGETLRIILKSLEAIGYQLHWKIINSMDFGVPQKRERWYCVGFREEKNFEFPIGTADKKPVLKDIINLDEKDDSLKLSSFELERIKFHFSNVKNDSHRVEHDNSMYEPHTKKGKHGVYSFQKSDKSLRFHVGDKAKTQIQEAFYSCLDTYAPTIIANRVPKLWDIERKLSVLEAQRLQAFPDNYIFPVSNNQAYKQLGNSVTTVVINEIGKEILKVI